MRRAAALLLALSACGREAGDTAADGAGPALERAALASGMVADPAAVEPIGVFAADGDRVCLLPAGGESYRIGISVDYGEGQHCVARGTARGRDDLAVDLGADCRFHVSLDNERLRFPAVLPAACGKMCAGRASLAAVTASRLSDSIAEASRLRDPAGELLCGS